MRYAGIAAVGILGSAMALPAQPGTGDRTGDIRPGGPEESPGFMRGPNWGSPPQPTSVGIPNAAAGAAANNVAGHAGATHAPGWSPSRPGDAIGVEASSFVDRVASKVGSFINKHWPNLKEEELKKVEAVVLENFAPSSTRLPSSWGSSGLPSTHPSTPTASQIWIEKKPGEKEGDEEKGQVEPQSRGNTPATINGVTVTFTATPWTKPTETSNQDRPGRHGGSRDEQGDVSDDGPHGGSHDGHGDGPGDGPHGGSHDGHGDGPGDGPHGGSHDGHGDGPGGGPHGGSGRGPHGGGGDKPTSTRSTVSPSSSSVPMLNHEAPASGGERPDIPTQ
ncbi:hypothetical protein N7474_005881 [Penicillium riverlandense]|uniref:uncharacterized protein n=1 Tax=Penicillium riverlandense TaxID=1903569 RepID=UPI002548E798|nr:uncharacterized protein N7474_005881 [Penicillium riverlandense]KAJ5820290.1 hypothetical protein N7474_005881 [Penicillium riverlandense]